MTFRLRVPGVLALVLALLLLAPATRAHADQAYDKVAGAYARSGGELDACTFTPAELEAAIAGIPPEIRDVVPDLRRAMEDGLVAHERGDCEGSRAGAGAGGAGAPTTPATPTTPTTPAPATTAPTTQTEPVVPAATTPPTTSTPAPATAQTPPAASTGDGKRSTTGLLIALVALGALLLLGLLTWGWGRMRGWDPSWLARRRHAWGEAGFRVTSTWSEFTDWLRLGR